jgi:dTDP-4-amino-4,6-dideoxygalactose transaminase
VNAAVGVGNGTDALYLALRALGVGPGHEVITVAHTFIATAEAISLTGARPVFVDIREDTMLMDPDALESAITPLTRAIVPVHLYGQPCEMDRIVEIARRHNLKVVEDAAQAHGARWRGRRVGSIGDVACFSFFPGKNLGAYGDAGGVVSQDEELVRRVRMLANHGRQDKYFHQTEGLNSRLDNLHAAVLRVKLQHLDEWNAARRRVAQLYMDLLKVSDAVLPGVHPDTESVWHLFVVRVFERDDVWKQLNERGIGAGVHYPVPLHRQPAYAHLGLPAGSLPVTERVASRVVSLPIYPELSAEQVAAVGRTLMETITVARPA